MRRKAWTGAAALSTVLLLLPATGAAAPPVPLPSPSPGTALCPVSPELGGITGLALLGNGGYAVTVKPGQTIPLKVYLFDAECRYNRKTVSYGGNGARDPQDVQVGGDGALWVADTGDDRVHPARSNVAVWKLSVDGGRSSLYRLTFTDRPQSAQAMLIGGDGTPIIITDNPNGPAGIYVPDGPLDVNKTVHLKHVGDFTPQDTGTENKLGKIGTSLVTGAANSHDGKHVAIRTYADAYEWSVTNGDVVGALTTGTPKITPLPNEAQGTAIAYGKDNVTFLTVSDVPVDTQTQILKYKASPPPVAKATPAAPPIAGKGDTRNWFGKLNLQDLLRLVGGLGVVGLLMVIGGIIGIRRGRRLPPPASANRRRPPPAPDDPDPANHPTAALAQMPTGRRDRYDGDPYEPDARYPDSGYGYARPDDPDRYAAPPPRLSSPPVSPPMAPPPNPPRRGDRGVARSHRPGNRRERDNPDPPRRGYSDQHDGFRDMLE